MQSIRFDFGRYHLENVLNKFELSDAFPAVVQDKTRLKLLNLVITSLETKGRATRFVDNKTEVVGKSLLSKSILQEVLACKELGHLAAAMKNLPHVTESFVRMCLSQLKLVTLNPDKAMDILGAFWGAVGDYCQPVIETAAKPVAQVHLARTLFMRRSDQPQQAATQVCQLPPTQRLTRC